jgi:hypothetical protein
MRKITLLCIALLAFCWQANAQFGCGSAVALTNGYTASGITTPGNGGPEDWNDNPTDGCGVSNFYWDDDVYLFSYTAGATDEEISMSIFSRNSWNGIGIFTICTGTTLDGCVATDANTAGNTAKTVTANVGAGNTVYIAVGQWGIPNDLDFDVTAFTVTPLVNPPSCTTLSTPLDGAVDVNEDTDLTWNTATGGPTGYFVSVGTTSGGTDIANNVDNGDSTTYVLPTLGFSTTYYVTITPYNSNGNATGCTEESFTTRSAPPAGSACSTAISINVESDCSTATPTTLDYSMAFDLGTTALSCDTFGVNTGSWYEFVAPASGSVSLNLVGETAEYSVYNGCGVEVTCVSSATNQGVISGLTPGATYQLAVWKDSATTGTTDICLEEILCAPPSSLGITNLTTTSADFGWTENGTATVWNIELVDITGGGTATGVPTNAGVMTNPFSFTGLTPGNDYEVYVQADCGISGTSSWVGPLSFTTPTPPPANDDFANAQALNCNDNITGSTSNATLDEDDAPDGFGADMDAPNVWFSFTGTGGIEDITIDLCPSAYDTSVLVYTGTSGALTLVAGNDDNGAQCGSSGGTTRSYVTFTSDGTTTYYIAVEGWNSSSVGNFDLTITCASACTPAQANQDCASTFSAMVDGMAFTVDNTCATINPTQPSCDSFNSIADVWYSFVAPASGEVDIITALGTATAAHMAVYGGTCGALVEEGCNATDTSSLSLTGLTGGATYYLQLWNNGSEEGTFDVTISDATLSVESAEVRGFTHYVNTVDNTFVVNAQSNISSIEVYNLVGQIITSEKPNATVGIAKLGAMRNGVFFARVTLDNGRTSIVKFAK